MFLDLQVLAAAPPRLIRAGLGDSLCRPTAQFDWLLAHLLLDRSYREAPFMLLAEDEGALFAESAALLAGDLDAMARLARTLVLSGFGMTICGGSHPASQGEHLIAHTAEMMADMTAPGLPETYHGEQIGVATLVMARLQQRLLEDGPPRLRPTGLGRAALIAQFGAELGAACWAEFEPKCVDAARAAELNERIAAHWDGIAGRLGAILRPAAELERVLQAAGAPTTARALSWPPASTGAAIRHARTIRNRYTALDLSGDSGLLERFVRDANAPEEGPPLDRT